MEMENANEKWETQTKMGNANGNWYGKQKWVMQMEMGMANRNG